MAHTVVIKIGTNVITRDDGLLDGGILASLSAQIAALQKSGTQVVVVSSGAMAAGRAAVKLSPKLSDVSKRQVLAAVGQVQLIQRYSDLLKTHGAHCAQVLATKEDFRDREHYLNMRNCFSALLAEKIIPIVNENDVVSVAELMFTDNDELAGMVASMMDAHALVLLTSVDGIYDGDPRDAGSRVLREVQAKDDVGQSIRPEKSLFGRGGMVTKSAIARKTAALGIHTYIANGKRPGVLADVLAGKDVGTHFLPAKKKASSIVRFVASESSEYRGTITVNQCAVDVILNKEKAVSVLPIGVTKVEGDFQKSDIVRILGPEGKTLGLGRASYSSDVAQKVLGKTGQKALIHYDYLFLF